MTSIVSEVVVVWVNRMISEGSVNWPHINRQSYPLKSVIFTNTKIIFVLNIRSRGSRSSWTKDAKILFIW